MNNNAEIKILDELLKTMSVSNSIKWNEIMNETLDANNILNIVDHYTFQVALLKLVKDGYVNETNKDINNPKKTNYHISFEGMFFIKNGGYGHERLEVQRKEGAYELLNAEQKLHASALLSLNRRMVFLTWIIALGTLIAALYYLLEILSFFGVYFDTSNLIFCIKPT